MSQAQQLQLPLALKGVKNALSKTAKREIMDLSHRRPGMFLFHAFLTWAAIFGSILLAVWADNLLVSLLVIFVIATRQNVLGLLVHDQAHCLGFKARPGDLITNLTSGF